jgi:hypothetical protein
MKKKSQRRSPPLALVTILAAPLPPLLVFPSSRRVRSIGRRRAWRARVLPRLAVLRRTRSRWRRRVSSARFAVGTRLGTVLWPSFVGATLSGGSLIRTSLIRTSLVRTCLVRTCLARTCLVRTSLARTCLVSRSLVRTNLARTALIPVRATPRRYPISGRRSERTGHLRISPVSGT